MFVARLLTLTNMRIGQKWHLESIIHKPGSHYFVFAHQFLGEWGKVLHILYSAYSHVHFFDAYKRDLLTFWTCHQANCCFFVRDVANFLRQSTHINPRWIMEMKCSSNTFESTASRIIVLDEFSAYRAPRACPAIVRVKGKLWMFRQIADWMSMPNRNVRWEEVHLWLLFKSGRWRILLGRLRFGIMS